jgi:O-antigen/teichoic acid export membrane protein
MSRLSKNIIYNLVGQGLLLILGFVAVKYVFSRLGADALGIIFFTATLSAVLSAILDMGICWTTGREVSAHFSDEPTYIRDLIRTASLFYWGAYVLLAAGIYWSAPWLVAKWVNLKTLDPAVATQVLRILGIAALVALPRSLYRSLLCGLQRMEFNNLIDVATSALQQFGTIVILVLGGQLLHVACWFVGSYALGLLAYLLVCARFFSFRALVPGYSAVAIWRNLSYSLQMMSISILGMIHAYTDKIIVSRLLPIYMFGLYGVAFAAVARTGALVNTISAAAFPSFAALDKKGDRVSLIGQYRSLQDLVCLATAPIFAAIAFAALPLFSYLLNADAARILIVPTTLLCLGFYVRATVEIPNLFCFAVGRPEIAVRTISYAVLALPPITALLIYSFGLVGAGLAWVCLNLFTSAYSVPRICSECLRIPAAEWYRRVVRIAGLAAGTYGGAWVILAALGTGSILSLVGAYAGASIAFLVGAYWMAGEELRGSLLHSFQALRLKLEEAL